MESKKTTLKEKALGFKKYVGDIRHTSDGTFWVYRKGVYRQSNRFELDVLAESYLESMAGKSAGNVSSAQVHEIQSKLSRNGEVHIGGLNMLNPKRKTIDFLNGMLDAEREEQLPHNPAYLSTIQLPYNYNPQSTCPRWEQFMSEILPEDTVTQGFLQEFFGYCLLPRTEQQIFLLLFGDGSNGKSVLVEIMKSLIGIQNCSFLSIAQLSSKFHVIKIANKLLNIGVENEDELFSNTAHLKKISGGREEIIGEEKFKQPASFIPFSRLVFVSNKTLKFKDSSYGFRRRMRSIKFTELFEGENRNKNLSNELFMELPGIFNWAIAGLKRLDDRGDERGEGEGEWGEGGGDEGEEERRVDRLRRQEIR